MVLLLRLLPFYRMQDQDPSFSLSSQHLQWALVGTGGTWLNGPVTTSCSKMLASLKFPIKSRLQEAYSLPAQETQQPPDRGLTNSRSPPLQPGSASPAQPSPFVNTWNQVSQEMKALAREGLVPLPCGCAWECDPRLGLLGWPCVLCTGGRPS